MKQPLNHNSNWLVRILFILVNFFVFQCSVITVSANATNLESRFNSSISPIYTYDGTKSSIGVVGVSGDGANGGIPKRQIGAKSESFRYGLSNAANTKWTLLKNCSSFSSRAFNYATGQNIMAHPFMVPVNTPSWLVRSLR